MGHDAASDDIQSISRTSPVHRCVKVDEDTVLTGCSDGLVRAVRILPNALFGTLGQHDGFLVEMLKFDRDRRMVGSVSHD